MQKKIVAISLVLVVVLSSVACAEEVQEEVELPLAQEIVDRVIGALDDQRTAQFEMDMTMDIAGEAEGEVFEMTMVMDSSGTLDLENSQIEMDMTMSMVMPGEGEIEMVMEIYLIGDMMYIMIDVPEMGPMWVKSETPEGTWAEMSQTEAQAGLLEAAWVRVIGSEKVRGIDCYVLELTPDMQQLWETAMQQAAVTGQGIPDVAEEFLEEMFRSFSVKQWVATDTYFLMKAEIDMAVELTPEAMGFPKEEGVITMDMSMVLLSYNYNQPVSIVLPPGAEEAIEMPME